jgi:hypothetical protein
MKGTAATYRSENRETASRGLFTQGDAVGIVPAKSVSAGTPAAIPDQHTLRSGAHQWVRPAWRSVLTRPGRAVLDARRGHGQWLSLSRYMTLFQGTAMTLSVSQYASSPV